MTPSIKSFLPPTIVETQNGRWAVAGGQWLPIPKTVTFEMLREAWVRDVTPKKVFKPGNWKVKGSKGDSYTVTSLDGQWNCTCPGFGFRRKCKHIDEVKTLENQ